MSGGRESGGVRKVRLGQDSIRYREAGKGAPIVFVHNLVTHGDLWRNVVPPLARSYRCIVPDWLLGAHRLPMDEDLTVAGAARTIAEFLGALDLREVTLVGNDTGGRSASSWSPTNRSGLGDWC